MEFKIEGTFSMHANNQDESVTYKLYPDAKLGIGDMVHGKAI